MQLWYSPLRSATRAGQAGLCAARYRCSTGRPPGLTFLQMERIEATADGFIIEGPTPLTGADVDGLDDHRMAMSLAVAALVAHGETRLHGAECVRKTYPGFFDDLARLSEV